MLWVQARKKKSAYVDYSLSWDVGGANRAGMASVWVSRRSMSRDSQAPLPDVEIASLTELPDVLLELSCS